MDGEIKRGEVYWLSFDDSVGSEMPTGRPAVIVSSDGKNAKSGTVICAYTTTTTTTTTESNPSRVGVWINNRQQWVVCDQVRTVDKSRLGKYVGTLTIADMKRVAGAMACAMGIPIAPPTQTPAAPTTNNADTLALRVELDTIKKQYEMVLTELVKMKVDADVSRLMSSPKLDEINTCTAEEKPAPKYEVDPTPERIEINTCTAEELKSAGCNDYLIKSIIDRRPYKSVEDMRGIPGMTNMGYSLLKTKVCCVPVVKETRFKMQPAPNVEKAVTETGKVNMNTATYDELVSAGIGKETVARIIDYRVTKGPFNSVKELLKVKYVGQTLYDKYVALLEV